PPTTAVTATRKRIKTRSGYYWRDLARSDAEAADELVAAQMFPEVDRATVLHLHADRLAHVDTYYDEEVAHLGLPPGELLIVVMCGAAIEAPGPLQAAAGVLAARGGRPVLATHANVFTTRDKKVLANLGFDAAGGPVLDVTRPGTWVVVWPDGSRSPGLGED